jgi:glycosyltransferase involved in cell wall biosynthesis
MRILVAHCVTAARNGGMSRLMGFLHDECEKKYGWQTDYLCSDGLPGWVLRRASQFVFPILVLRRIWWARHRGQPYDIINVHEPSAVAAVFMSRFGSKSQVIVTTHGLEQRAWELDKAEAKLGRKRLRWRSRVLRTLTILWPSRYALKHARHIFCLNEQDKEYLQRWLGRKADSITRLFPGINPIFLDGAEVRSYQRADKLLFAGTWRHNKGIIELVETFEALARKNPTLTLTVLGAGASKEEVVKAFSEEIRQRIDVIPFATETESAAIFGAADIFLLPSLFEGTPLTLIEAMASGLPVITTDTCGMRDVIQHNVNGLLVPIRDATAIANAVGRLRESLDLRLSLGRQANADASRKYSWTRSALPVMEVYLSIQAERD